MVHIFLAFPPTVRSFMCLALVEYKGLGDILCSLSFYNPQIMVEKISRLLFIFFLIACFMNCVDG